jgi:Cof subfamily protein (haloacid dehalogenase superfamily)
MAAIDLDGTLLSHDTQISPENKSAVQRLQAAGVQVVLASGRHYKNMLRYAEQLPGVQWIISCQGCELCNLDRSEILTTEALPVATVKETLDKGASLGFTTVAYGIDSIYTEADWNSDLQFYADLSGYRPIHRRNREFLNEPIGKLIWMGDPGKLDEAVQSNPVNATEIHMVRTHGRLLEFMPVGISKASALKILAARLSVDASEAMAFGDGDNDVPMFEWAGVSVAMSHGWPAALKKATYIAADGPAESDLARAIDLLFEKQLLSALETDKS